MIPRCSAITTACVRSAAPSFSRTFFYAVHFHRLRTRYFDLIRRHHLFHHGARGRDVAFGLTSGLWDVPFKTAAPHAVRRRAENPNAPAGRK